MLDRPIDFDHWDLHQDVLGIDEAGRGPIAGPLVVAGVCFEKGFTALFSLITNEALWYQILVIEEKIIDKKNIYRTTQEAMLAIAHNAPVDIVLSDAMPLPSLDKEWESVIKGDQKSLSIAAASILAKVTRDRYMKKLDELYPMYGFSKHKGYPTKAHIEALNTYGVLDCHRRSYGPVQKMLEIKLF